jgi:hypothetical protein
LHKKGLCGGFDRSVWDFWWIRTEVHFVGRFGFGFTCEGGGVGLVLVVWDLIEDLL